VGECWKDATLSLPGSAGGAWKDVFTGRTFAGMQAAPLSGLFSELPVAVLIAQRDSS
jgi:maltooligosyltrehalose synthase